MRLYGVNSVEIREAAAHEAGVGARQAGRSLDEGETIVKGILRTLYCAALGSIKVSTNMNKIAESALLIPHAIPDPGRLREQHAPLSG